MFIQAVGLGRFAIEISSQPAQNASKQTFSVPVVTKVPATPEELELARANNPASA
jgi:hypothetical protein